MKTLIPGERIHLSEWIKEDAFQIRIELKTNHFIEMSCFGLDAEKKLRDPRFMIFFNQKFSPKKAISFVQEEATKVTFQISLSKLPPDIFYLQFTGILDGKGDASDFCEGSLTLSQQGTDLVAYCFRAKDFQKEKAVIFAEIYLKKDWCLAAIGRGFDGGLSELMRYYHGNMLAMDSPDEVASEAEDTPQQDKLHIPRIVRKLPIPLSTKDLQSQAFPPVHLNEKAPHLIPLSEKARHSIEKAGAENLSLHFALCLDISTSMVSLYHSGKMQVFAEKMLAFTSVLHQVYEIQVFLFGRSAYDAGSLSLDTYPGFVDSLTKHHPFETSTYYGKAIACIRNHYFKHSRDKDKSQRPVYVMFVTDGGTFDSKDAKEQIIAASNEPIFWQFMGIGRSNRSIIKNKGFKAFFTKNNPSQFLLLEQLDKLTQRRVDNTHFFSVERLEELSDELLYDLMLSDYLRWYTAVKKQRIL